jgi:hypothetical protein
MRMTMTNSPAIFVFILSLLAAALWSVVSIRSLAMVRVIKHPDLRLRIVLLVTMILTTSIGLVIWGLDLLYGLSEDVNQFALAMTSTMSLITSLALITTWPKKGLDRPFASEEVDR